VRRTGHGGGGGQRAAPARRDRVRPRQHRAHAGRDLGRGGAGAIYAALAGQGVAAGVADPALVLAGVQAAFRCCAGSAFTGALVAWACIRRGALEPVPA
jgi:hypothetical protein